MRCEYTYLYFSSSDTFNPFNQEIHLHDYTNQCWVKGNDVAKFVSSDGKEAMYYCLFHAHHAPTGWTQTKWNKTCLGEKQSDRLTELLYQWNIENGKRKSNSETLFAFSLPGMQCGEVDFTGHSFSHNLDFSNAKFSGHAGFDGTTFRSALFREVTFSGYFLFSDATVSYASFDEATFIGSAHFSNTTFSGPAWFEKATFSGVAWFNKAAFRDFTWFGDTTFSDAFSFNDATCSGAVTFRSSTFNGDASFKSSKFHNEITFLLAKMEKGGRFVNCQFGSFNYQTHIGERLLFNHCSTGEKLDFIDQDCSRLAFLNMDLTKADFLGADVSKARFDACQWKEKGGPKYAAVYKHLDYLKKPVESADEEEKKKNDEDYKNRVSKLKALYRQLMKNLEENREYKQAGDFHYREMELRQKTLKDGLADPESWFERPMLCLYRFVGDFGESYVKLGFCLIASWFVSAVLLWSYNPDKTFWHILGIVIIAIIPGWSKPETVVQTLSKFNPFCKTVLVVEMVVAVILTTLFAMAVNRRYRR